MATCPRCTITNCTLRESGQYGLTIDQYSVVEGFSGNTLTASALGAASVHCDSAGYLDDSSTYSGNDVDVVVLTGKIVDRGPDLAGGGRRVPGHR